jgi:thioredoxin-related protein
MKRWRAVLTAVVLLTALTVNGSAQDKAESKKAESAKPDSIEWLSFPDGLQKGKAEEKHVLVDFTASWCSWCKKMDRETFKDSAVVAMINEKFVPVKVWGDSDDMLDIEGYQITEKQLATSEFNVRGYPAFWFISPEGQRIGPLPGYQTAERMIKALDYVATKQYVQDAKKQDSDDK